MPFRVRLRSMPSALRGQTVDTPSAVTALAITKAVMKAVLALLPELDFAGIDTISSPMFWTLRAGFRIPGLQFRKLGFQSGSRLHDRALFGNGGAEPAAARPRVEILIRFGWCHFGHAAGDANLTVERSPIENQRGIRVFLKLLTFAAFVVREEDEALLVDAFEQHHSGRWFARAGCGGERHGGRLLQSGFEGDFEPFLKLPDGVGIGVALSETCQIPV